MLPVVTDGVVAFMVRLSRGLSVTIVDSAGGPKEPCISNRGVATGGISVYIFPPKISP